jgi:release factor glutamine methyltransferase
MRLLPLPGVFRPPSDAWLLARCIAQEQLPPSASALDLCTGSGVLALAAAHAGASRVVAVDISRRAVLATRLNAAINGVSAQAVRGDLFDAVGGERFDLIVSNPPYVPSANGALPSRGLSRAWEGGSDGRAFLDRICAEAAGHLRPGGVLLLVHSSVCGEEKTRDALQGHGLVVSLIQRQRGALGPLLRSRASMLRAKGLLRDDWEEMLVFRAQRSHSTA